MRAISEGGSGATYQEMADSMGIPAQTAVVELDDSLRRAGVRDRLQVFASGKLSSPDRVALALCMGADAVNIARGLMIAVGCIQAQKCHTNQCPVGVATTDPKLMNALVVEEKRYRVANYILALRGGHALAGGCRRTAIANGVRSPPRRPPGRARSNAIGGGDLPVPGRLNRRSCESNEQAG